MSITTHSAEGLLVRIPNVYGDAHVPVDFAIAYGQRSFVALGEWWRTQWAESETLIIDGAGEVIPADDGWRIDTTSDVHFRSPEDAEEREELDTLRKWQDVERLQYMEQLDYLSNAYPQVPFTEWYQVITARSIRNLAEEARLRVEQFRKVVKIVVVGLGNIVLDVLAADEFGNAATATGNSWTVQMAEVWRATNPRPNVDEWASWIATQQPHGLAAIARVVVTEEKGPLLNIATKALTAL